jgi:hypothetical protein
MDFAWAGNARPALAGTRRCESVLVLGSLGDGVGLLHDLLVSAAERSGQTVIARQSHRRDKLGTTAQALVRLQGRGSPISDQPADLLVAFDCLSAGEGFPLLKPEARALVRVPGRFRNRSRFGALADPRVETWQELPLVGRRLAAPCWAAGWLSGSLEIASDAWREALEEQIPRRQRAFAQAAFDGGRLAALSAVR